MPKVAAISSLQSLVKQKAANFNQQNLMDFPKKMRLSTCKTGQIMLMKNFRHFRHSKL
jgi:hypothetical protein